MYLCSVVCGSEREVVGEVLLVLFNGEFRCLVVGGCCGLSLYVRLIGSVS